MLHDHYLANIARPRAEKVAAALADYVPQGVVFKPNNFLANFKTDNYHVIAELKYNSPSNKQKNLPVFYQGNLTPVEIFKSYQQAQAAAVSVLTEPEDFEGNTNYLRLIRTAYPEANLLMKDFIVSEAQIKFGAAEGASAVLLIVAMLNDTELQHLHAYAQSLGLTVLVEVHTKQELERALQIKNLQLLGVNNRDLLSLKTNLQTSYDLMQYVPQHMKVISESGIKIAADMQGLKQAGYHGFLIGETFMRTPNPGQALADILAVCHAG